MKNGTASRQIYPGIMLFLLITAGAVRLMGCSDKSPASAPPAPPVNASAPARGNGPGAAPRPPTEAPGTDLTKAVKSGDRGTEEVSKLLASGADVNAKNPDGSTALMYASNAATAKALLEKGADVKAVDAQGNTALMHVGNPEAATLLLTKGVDLNAQNTRGETALLQAAGLGNTAMVKLLISRGADVNLAAKDGTTPLMATVARRTVPQGAVNVKALTQDRVDILHLLLSKGSDPNVKLPARNSDMYAGETALMAAARSGVPELVKELLSGKADAKIADAEGSSALIKAAGRGTAEAVQMLIAAGADVNAKDSKGETALSAANKHKSSGHKKSADLLMQAGAKG